jgi:hypothetical protein
VKNFVEGLEFSSGVADTAEELFFILHIVFISLVNIYLSPVFKI